MFALIQCDQISNRSTRACAPQQLMITYHVMEQSFRKKTHPDEYSEKDENLLDNLCEDGVHIRESALVESV